MFYIVIIIVSALILKLAFSAIIRSRRIGTAAEEKKEAPAGSHYVIAGVIVLAAFAGIMEAGRIKTFLNSALNYYYPETQRLLGKVIFHGKHNGTEFTCQLGGIYNFTRTGLIWIYVPETLNTEMTLNAWNGRPSVPSSAASTEISYLLDKGAKYIIIGNSSHWISSEFTAGLVKEREFVIDIVDCLIRIRDKSVKREPDIH